MRAPFGIVFALLFSSAPFAVPASSRPLSVSNPPEASKDGGQSERQRYIELYKRKEQAERLNALWKVEADLSAKRTTYAVLDLSDRKLYFKVRGRVFKAIPITALEAHRSAGPVDLEELAWKAFTLQIKEGKGVETETIQRKALTSEEAAKSGRSGAEDEPIGAEQGAADPGAVTSGAAPPSDSGAGGNASDSNASGTQKMAGVAGGLIPPDPPPKYHMGFDGGLSLWVEAEIPPTPHAGRFSTVISWAKTIGRLLSGTSEERHETRIILHLPLAQGQQIFRQLLPGQRLLVTL